MMRKIQRRLILLAGLPLPLTGLAAPQAEDSLQARCAALQTQIGGQIGVFALHTGSRAQFGFQAEQRFAMCSTFKLLLAAAVLAKVDSGRLDLNQRVRFGPRDLVPHAPVTGELLQAGSVSASLSVGELCAAMLELSDNPAANLLLPLVGGPAGLTRFLRELGDTVTRLDRIEPALNSNLPDDARDTSTAASYVGLMEHLLCSDYFSGELRQQLLVWMNASETGLQRLRAGAPQDWPAGDKTGSGANGAVNDVAIFFPPKQAPILMAVFMTGSTQSLAALNAVHAELATLVLSHLQAGDAGMSR
ncbi:class A beta-lactamase [Paucibacter sp. TC2R-5]|uniref:class A beta-lactamase n=1 Tax=Paucibacter sp. TC2R-5 TaxID=2893555 RepID=UPI0021E39CC8|nr:class A beta-lactamase [Paucibacter sp. TC2R-5]MCV2358748.1 class A beta-lactamase [Paucibacter sp. TC2R-5]